MNKGAETVFDSGGRYCCVPATQKVSLGEIADLLEQFKSQPHTLLMRKKPNGSFEKKLYSPAYIDKAEQKPPLF